MAFRHEDGARRKLASASAYVCERLEIRRLLSTISWINEGTTSNDTDGFNSVFGSNATAARAVVQADITNWENVITSFNYSDNRSYYALTVNMATTGTSLGAVTSVTSSDGNDPDAATITIGRGNSTTVPPGANGNGGGYLLDNTVGPSQNFESSAFDETAWASNASTTAAAGKADLYTLVLHEVGHAMGMDPNSEMGALSHKTTTTDHIDTVLGGGTTDVGYYYVFIGADVSCLLTSYNSSAGGGGTDAGGPIHFAPLGASATYNGKTYTGAEDLLTPYYNLGERKLISDADALMLKDAYGYTVVRPDTQPTFYDWIDANGNLQITPGANASSSGSMNITNDGAVYNVFLNLNDGSSNEGNNGEYNANFITSQIKGIDVAMSTQQNTTIVDPVSTMPIAVTGNVDGYEDLLTLVFPSANNTWELSTPPTQDGMGYIDGGANVTYFGIGSIELGSTGGTQIVELEGLPYETRSFEFDGTTGSDTLDIAPQDGSISDSFPGFYSGFGTIDFDGGIGTNNTLNIEDASDTGNWTDFVLSSQIVMSGTVPTQINIPYSDIQAINIYGNAGADAYGVYSVPLGETLTIDGGSGGNTFYVGNSVKTALVGNLHLAGGSGNDQVTLDDTGDATSQSYTLGFGYIQDGGTLYLGSGIDGVELEGSNTGSTFNVSDILVATTLLGGSGTDSFLVGRGNIDGLLAPLTINGGAGSNTIFIDDTLDTVGTTDVIGAGTFSDGLGSAGWSNVASVRFASGPKQDNIYITGTTAGTPLEVDDGNTGGPGPDHVYVSSDTTLADGVLSGLKSLLTLSSSGNGAAVQVSEAGETTDDSVTVNEASGLLFSTALGWTIHFPGNVNAGGIEFTGGQGDDTIDVVSTFIGESYTVDGGPGSNTFDVNSPAIEGPLTVNGEGNDTLNVSDSPDTATSNVWTMTGSSLTRVPSSGYTMVMYYSNIPLMNVTGSQHNDTFNVTGTSPSTYNVMNGGATTTTFNIGGTGAGDTSGIMSEVVIESPGAGQTSNLNVNDSGASSDVTYHVGGGLIGAQPGDNLFGPNGLIYFYPISNVSVSTGSGQDNAWVTPDEATPISVEGNAPTTSLGDTLHLALASAVNPVFTPGGTEGSGSYTYDNGPGMSYDGFETVDASQETPEVLSAKFTLYGGKDALEFTFSEPVVLSTSFLTLYDTRRSTMIDQSVLQANDQGTNTIYVTFPGLSGGVLPSSVYDVTLSAPHVTDISGNALAADYSTTLNFTVAEKSPVPPQPVKGPKAAPPEQANPTTLVATTDDVIRTKDVIDLIDAR